MTVFHFGAIVDRHSKLEEIVDVLAECSARDSGQNPCDLTTANNLVVKLGRCCCEVEAHVASATENTMDDSTCTDLGKLHTCLSHMLVLSS